MWSLRSRWVTVLRWVSFVPAAMVVFIVPIFLAVAWTPVPYWGLFDWGLFGAGGTLGALGAVYLASRIAPAFRRVVAGTVGGLLVIAVSTLLFRASGKDIYILILWVVGGLLGTLLAFRRAASDPERRPPEIPAEESR